MMTMALTGRLPFGTAVAIVLALSCQKRETTTYVGLPPGAKPACGNYHNDYEITCVADGRAYLCVSNKPAGCGGPRTISCGLMGSPISDQSQQVDDPVMQPAIIPDEEEEEDNLSDAVKIERLHVMYNIHPECSTHECYEKQNSKLPGFRIDSH